MNFEKKTGIEIKLLALAIGILSVICSVDMIFDF